MQNARRGGPAARSGATEAKSTAKGREADTNRDRLIFVLTSLVGQRVTAKLRDNVMYEGLFHSFSYENDLAIILKSARKLASEMSKSGKVMESLIIPGKDFLQVSALEVPSPSVVDKNDQVAKGDGFKTDGEITQKAAGGERELVAWAGAAGTEKDELCDDTFHKSKNGEAWDQFATNEQMFGVSTTFNEELYTTKLDPSSIPKAKREEADRLAREIESGVQNSEFEEAALNGDNDDEEGKFSAVTNSGAYKKGAWGNGNGEAIAGTGGAAPSAKARGNGKGNAPLPQIPPMPEDRMRQDDGLDPRSKRLAGNSPAMMKTSMISEMKRINALNLEPAVPKLEDKAGGDWINFQQQSRNANKPAGGNGLKMEFQQSLDIIQKREANKQQQQEAKLQQQQQDSHGNSSSDNWRGGKGGNQVSLPSEAMQGGQMMHQRGGGANMQMGGGSGGDSTRSKFSFNPNAKDFTFNPGAVSFTPSNAGSGPAAMPSPNAQQGPGGGMQQAPSQAGAQAAQTAKAIAASPPFHLETRNNNLVGKKLEDILDGFHGSSKNEALSTLDPGWPEAQGPSYHDVLGRPNPANPLPPVGNMGAQPMGAPWQQQQQQQQQQPMGQAPAGAPVQGGGGQGAPQMMPQQNFMAPSGQNPQMFQPMYQQGPGGQMPQQRPQNAQNMPPQDQQQQQQQQNMGFNQQNMIQPQPGPGQAMAVPSGMVNPQGGQNPGGFTMQPMPGGAMPKYGMQAVMMVPQGQYPQGFQPQPGQPGQPGPQPGGPPGGPQQGGHWQQGHMMPVHMQQVGPRGPPHPMGGHDG